LDHVIEVLSEFINTTLTKTIVSFVGRLHTAHVIQVHTEDMNMVVELSVNFVVQLLMDHVI